MRHHSQSEKKLKQKNPRSNAWCRYRCWWWRWCAQGPTRRHFGYLRSIFESPRNKLLSSCDPHQVTLFWHIFCHAIRHSHFISYISCNSFWHAICYIFGDSLWSRSGGHHSDHNFRCFCCCCCWCCCCCCCFCCCWCLFSCCFCSSCCCCCGCCCRCFCPVVAENCQIGWNSPSKQHRKYWCFLRLESPKPRIYNVFCIC